MVERQGVDESFLSEAHEQKKRGLSPSLVRTQRTGMSARQPHVYAEALRLFAARRTRASGEPQRSPYSAPATGPSAPATT